MLVCGIDEAGRGPVLGPLCIGSVILDDAGRKELKDLGVRDSKKLSSARREEMEPRIKQVSIEWRIISITPNEIDFLRKRLSLNHIEASKMADIILSHDKMPPKVIVDAADPVAENYGERIRTLLKQKGCEALPEIVSEHKADDNYIEVSAASVLAKVARDRSIAELRMVHGELGSGYPSDEVTMEYLKKLSRSGAELPSFVRKSWISVKRGNQTSLGEF